LLFLLQQRATGGGQYQYRAQRTLAVFANDERM
jgi:hypothetical protein